MDLTEARGQTARLYIVLVTGHNPISPNRAGLGETSQVSLLCAHRSPCDHLVNVSSVCLLLGFSLTLFQE